MPRDPRRDQVLDSAAQLFAERGYPTASVREVAAAAGFTKAGVYYHIRGKEDLLYAICAESIEAILESVEATFAAETDPARTLTAVVRVHVGFFHEHPARLRVLKRELGFLSPRRKAEVVKIQRRYLDGLRAVLRRGMLRGQFVRLDPTVAAFLLLSMLNGLDDWYDPGGRMGADAIAAHIARVFLAGILTDRAGLPTEGASRK
jgi:AcrR family transcriptional regulator